MRRVALLVLISLLPCPMAFAQSKDHSANGRFLKGTFTAARAMELIYGHPYDAMNGISDWKPNQAHTYPNDWPERIDVDVLLDASYVESETPEHLLVTWAKPNMHVSDSYNCHACHVLIGITLFAKTSDGWRVKASDLQFGYYGIWGHPPSPISVQPIGPSRYGLTIYWEDEGQGIVNQGIVIIVPTGDTFAKAFDSELADSWDEDGCSGKVRADLIDDCFAYDGDVDFLPNPLSDYYDLVLTKRIYRSLSKKNPVGTSTIRYHFDGSKYIPTAPSVNGPGQSHN